MDGEVEAQPCLLQAWLVHISLSALPFDRHASAHSSSQPRQRSRAISGRIRCILRIARSKSVSVACSGQIPRGRVVATSKLQASELKKIICLTFVQGNTRRRGLQRP